VPAPDQGRLDAPARPERRPRRPRGFWS